MEKKSNLPAPLIKVNDNEFVPIGWISKDGIKETRCN